MEIALVNEGTYPITTGGVSTWCHQLLEGMPEHRFHVVTVTGPDDTPITWPTPQSVASTTLHPVWGRAASSWTDVRPFSRSRRRWISHAMHAFWSAVLPPAPAGGFTGPVTHDPAAVGAAVRALVAAGNGRLRTLLVSPGSAEALLAAWEHHAPGLDGESCLTVGAAADAAAHIDRILSATDVDFPEVDVVHASSNGAAALIAVARKWRDGTPFALTEHGVYLRERYLALGGTDLEWESRYAVATALRALCELAYAEADRLLPVSDFNSRWASRLGAEADRSSPVLNGVDPTAYPPSETEPDVPTISFVGRIDPLKDLHTLLRAFALVRATVPKARLRIFGPCPDSAAAYQADLLAESASLGIEDAVTWEGPSEGSRPALLAGHVVALSSVSEGLPLTLIEAMMSGKATVSTDVGGVVELVGRSGDRGALVPPKDPEAFATECIRLLTDRAHRARVGAAARRHAQEHLTLQSCVGSFRRWYAELAGEGETTPAAFLPASVAPTAMLDQPVRSFVRLDPPLEHDESVVAPVLVGPRGSSS